MTTLAAQQRAGFTDASDFALKFANAAKSHEENAFRPLEASSPIARSTTIINLDLRFCGRFPPPIRHT
jgi:hypothetical protein